MAWGKSSSLKSCSNLLTRLESNDPTFTSLVILPPPLKVFTVQDARRLASVLNREKGGGVCCQHYLRTLQIPHDMTECLDLVRQIGESLVIVVNGGEATSEERGGGLRELDLGNGTFGDEGAMALADGIMSGRRRGQHNTESLVGKKKEDDEIAAAGAMIALPYTTTTLEVLQLSRRGITGSGMKALGSALVTSLYLRHIDLSGNQGKEHNSTEDVVAPVALFCSSALCAFEALTSVEQAAAGYGKATPFFPSLEYLDVSFCSIRAFPPMNRVQTAVMEEGRKHCDDEDTTCFADDDDLSRIRNFLRLIHSNSKTTTIGSDKKNASRKEEAGGLGLNLSGNPLFDNTTSSKEENDGNGLYAISSIKELVGNGILTNLNVAKCPSIGKYKSAILTLSASLESPTCRLSTLNLSECNLDTSDVKLLAKSLRSNTSLKELCLAGNDDIGVEGALALASALGGEGGKEETSSPGENQRDDNPTTTTTNTTLQILDMSNTNTGPNGATSLLQCQHLTSLRLFNNNLGGQQQQQNNNNNIDQLIEAICTNVSLQQLDLGGNKISRDDVITLLNEIRTSCGNNETTLTILEIGGNGSGPDVVEAVELLQQVRPQLDIAYDKRVTQA